MSRNFLVFFLVGLIFFITSGCSQKSTSLPIRNSVKILLLNDNNELLLMSSHNPSNKSITGEYHGRYWSLIGGAIEAKESLKEAAAREIYEETGIQWKEIEFGPIVWYGEFDLILHDTPTHIKQTFIVAKTKQKNLSLSHLTEFEKNVVKELAWFSLEKIQNCSEVVYPVVLPEYLPDIFAEKYPDTILEIDLAKQPKKKIQKR